MRVAAVPLSFLLLAAGTASATSFVYEVIPSPVNSSHDIAHDRAGRIYLAYQNYDEFSMELAVRSPDEPSGWAMSLFGCSFSEGARSRVSLSIDRDGDAHVAVASFGGTQRWVDYLFQEDGVWQTCDPVLNGPGLTFQWVPELTADSADRVHLFAHTSSGNSDTYYYLREGDEWTEVFQLPCWTGVDHKLSWGGGSTPGVLYRSHADYPTYATVFTQEPFNALGDPWESETVRTGYDEHLSFQFGILGIPHVAFGGANGVEYGFRDTTGEWIISTVLPGYWVQGLELAIDHDQDPHLVFKDRNTEEIWYARRVNDVWTAESVGGMNFNDSFAFVLDPYDNPHITYWDRTVSELIYASVSDCDGDGVLDSEEVAGGAADCNGNGIPDDCEIDAGLAYDCNDNGVIDACGLEPDCDGDGTPDDCEILAGTAFDCDGSGVPDACEVGSNGDCDANGESDRCQFSDELTLVGGSRSANGDVNGDGLDDVILGDPEKYSGSGYAALFYGANPMDTTADRTYTGSNGYDALGTAVAMGDLNHDGFDDYVIGAPGPGPGDPSNHNGSFLIGYGAADDADVVEVVYDTPGWKDQLGYALAVLDVNGDGHDDLVVGVGRDAEIQFFLGNPFDLVPDATWNGAPGSDFGKVVERMGDVDNDGLDDLFVGLPSIDEAHVYLSQYGTLPVAGPVLSPVGSGELFGFSGGGVGDVNLDGFADVIVGAPSSDESAVDSGRAYLYLGGAGMDAVPDVTFEGTAAGEGLGRDATIVPDVNRDGYADVLLGNDTGMAPPLESGRAYLFLGGPAMDTDVDKFFPGQRQLDEAGFAVGYAGDTDGDGSPEVLVGAPGSCQSTCPGGPFESRSYLFEFDLPALGDCNANGVADACDIAEGTSSDSNADGVPDECQSTSSVPTLHSSGLVALAPVPNPTDHTSVIAFELSQASSVRLEVFDITGRLVITLLSDAGRAPGRHRERWNGRDRSGRHVAPGMYFSRITVRGASITREIVLVD